MENTEDLERLAEICLANAKTIKEYLAKNGHPQPTFDQNGPIFYPQMSPEVEFARLNLRQAAKTLNDLATGPDDVGQHAYNCLHDLNAYRYVYHYKVAFTVPDNEVVPYKEVAEKTGTDERQLKRFIRHLIQIRTFCEPKPGYVAHTAASKALKHPGLSAFNAYNSFDNVPLVASQIDAFEKWGHGSQEPNEAPGNLVYNSDRPIYEIYTQRPEILDRFNNLMIYVSGFEHYSNAHIAAGFDWKKLGKGTVVDIGGNMGHCCIDILNANPDLKCIVQDQPVVVAEAKALSKTLFADNIRNQISFMDHDFYQPNPVQADAYFMRMIMHDYSDKYCIKILRAIIPAMKPGSRIIIMDQILPPVGQIHPVFDRLMRTMQLQMQLLANGTEREQEEWEELFKAADPRLKLVNVVTPPGSLMSLLEVVLEE